MIPQNSRLRGSSVREKRGSRRFLTPGEVRFRVAEEPTSFRGVSKRTGQLGPAGEKFKQVKIAID